MFTYTFTLPKKNRRRLRHIQSSPTCNSQILLSNFENVKFISTSAQDLCGLYWIYTDEWTQNDLIFTAEHICLPLYMSGVTV